MGIRPKILEEKVEVKNMSKKTIITVATTGAWPKKKDNLMSP